MITFLFSTTLSLPNRLCSHVGVMQGLQDARVNLIGDIEAVEQQDLAGVRSTYKQQHPNSFWIDFGDFSMWRLTPKLARLIGGFARAGQVSMQPRFEIHNLPCNFSILLIFFAQITDIYLLEMNSEDLLDFGSVVCVSKSPRSTNSAMTQKLD